MGVFYVNMTSTVPKYGGEYKEGIVGQPIYINPLLSQTSQADSDIVSLVYSGLFKYDKSGKVVMDMAENYKISEDKKEYEIQIKKNIKWHSGENLTAKDIEFTFMAIQDASYKSPLRQSFQGVDIKVIDDFNIIFYLKNPYMGFLESLTVGILPKYIWENISPEKFSLAEYNMHPIGTGPYVFVDFQKNSDGNILSLHLNSFKNFYDQKPYISKITFNFYPDDESLINGYNKKEIMGMSSVAPERIGEIKNEKSTKIFEISMPRYFALFLNQTKNFSLAHDEVRKALNLSVDRNFLIEKALNGRGFVLFSPFSEKMDMFNMDYNKIDFNIDEANKILDEAGWKLDSSENVRKKDGKNLEFEVVTTDWPELAITAEILKEQWNRIGAKVNIKTLSISDIQQNYIKTREYDSILFGQAITFNPDLYSFWHSSQKRDPGLNLSLFDNKDADEILESLRQNTDESKRIEDYTKLQEIISKKQPAVFLYGQAYLYPINTGVYGVDIENINLPSQRFSDISKWYIKTSRVFK